MRKKLTELQDILKMASTRGVTKDHIVLLVMRAYILVGKLKDEYDKETEKQK